MVFTLPDPRQLEITLAKKFDKHFSKNTEWRQFSNGEWFVRILNMPTRALVLGRTEVPGDHIVQTMTLLDTLKRNGAKDITLVLPYFGYCRHDRIVRKGDHLPADLLPRLVKMCGASRIITVDLHSPLTEKNSPIPLITLDFIPELVSAFKKTHPKKELLTIVSPDHGSKHRADAFRDLFDRSSPICWLEKHRDPATGRVCAHTILGMTQGTSAMITDDICDTGGTIEQAVLALKKKGFKTLYLCITHPVFSAHAVPLLKKLSFKKIFVSNTIPLSEKAKKSLPITVIDAAPALARSIKKLLLFDNSKS